MPPFFANLGRRLIKSPKLYIADPGMACHLPGIDNAAELAKSPFRGALFEGFMASEIVKRQMHAGGRREIYHFRDEHVMKVDFVLPGRGGSMKLVECKAGRTVTPAMAEPLRRLAAACAKSNPAQGGVASFLVHEAPRAGNVTAAVLPGVQALAWPALLAQL